MRDNDLLKRLNRSPYLACAVCAAIFLIMLLCNFRTNLIADDYRYCFSFADGSRIERAADIIPSMSAHRQTMNGRVFAHALVQLFLLLPPAVFKVLNSLMFLLLVWLIYRMALGRHERNVLLLSCVFGCLWLFQSQFGQVFLWLDGSINYLWCAVLSLLFLLPYIRKFLFNRELRPWQAALFTVYSLFVGGYSENSTVAVVFVALLLLLLSTLHRGFSLRLWPFPSLAALALGFVYMLFAPAELMNKSAEFSLPVLLQNFADTGLHYLRFWPLLAVFALLYIAACRVGTPREPRILALVLLGGSLAGHFVLTFAMYCAGRSTYIGLVLLLLACCVLFAELFDDDRFTAALTALGILCLVFTAYWGWRGVADIMKTNYNLSFNEQIIIDAAANGEKDVQLPRYYPRTKYSALEGLPYLETSDTTDWSNVYMAKYYGVDTVIGY